MQCMVKYSLQPKRNTWRIIDMKFKVLMFAAILFIPFGTQSQQDFTLRHSIYFHGGRYYITLDQLVELKEVVDSLFEVGNYSMTIHSHTDNIGGEEYNEWLSKMRSYTTKRHLESFGVDPIDMHIEDFGQHNPLYDNSTQEGRELNRRVDIIFWPLSL